MEEEKQNKQQRAEAAGARRRRLALWSHGAARHSLTRRREPLRSSAGRPGGSLAAAPAEATRVLQLRVRAGALPARRNAAPSVADHSLDFRSLREA
jgi:hypothetical protein